MTNKYAYMDKWSDDKIALIKDGLISMHEMADEVFGGTENMPQDRRDLKIVSEGDSWFDYRIGIDLVDSLRRFHRYRITNYARLGDTLENMIYGTRVNRRFERTMPQIKTVLARVEEIQPDIFLFSGGGNDIAGDQFSSYLHHAESNLGVLKRDYALDTILVTFRKYFEDLISKVINVSPQTHIFTHGYGYARPTGRGAGILGIEFVGPWLLPALGMKGIDPDTDGRQVIETLIDLYNEMLDSLDRQYRNFHHIDLRSIINDDDWRDELHLRSSAYRASSDKFDHAIRQIYPVIE